MQIIKFNVSPSAINVYNESQLNFFYTYIKKSQPDTETFTCYGNAGSCVHEILEYYAKNKNIDYEKKFNKKWKEYNLDNDLGLNNKPLNKFVYYNSLLRGIKLLNEKYFKYKPEEEILFKLFNKRMFYKKKFTINIKGIIDLPCYDKDNNFIIVDYKTSSQVDKSEKFKLQARHYAWSYWKKYNILPKKCIFEYLKINDKVEYVFTEQDMHEHYKMLINFIKTILKKGDDITKYEIGEYNTPFCVHKKKILEEKERRNKEDTEFVWTINETGHEFKIDGPFNDKLHEKFNEIFSYELKNAYYIKRNYPNANTTVNFWNANKRILPIGFIERAIKCLKDFTTAYGKKFVLNVYDNKEYFVYKDRPQFPDNCSFILRDYQLVMLEHIKKNDLCLLEVGTGGGKTNVLIESIRQLNLKTLFVVDRKELLNQTKTRLENENIDCGVIGNSEYNPDYITVATIQSLNRKLDVKTLMKNFKLSLIKNRIKNELNEYIIKNNVDDDKIAQKYQKKLIRNYRLTNLDLKEINQYQKKVNKEFIELVDYLETVEYLITDECHKISADSYMRVGRYIKNSIKRVGVTGTAFRDDGEDMKITAQVGYIKYTKSAKQLENEGWLVKPKIMFYETNFDKQYIKDKELKLKTGLINETISIHKLYKEFIVQCDKRNELIKNVVNNLLKQSSNEQSSNEQILITVKQVEHGELLETLIPNSKYLHGSLSNKKRDEMFNDFKNKKLKVLISTLSIIAEGIDIPHLRIVINASANSGAVKTIQLLGRILRLNENKKDAIYIDFIDSYKMYKKASYEKYKILRKQGHNVERVKMEETKK